MFNYSTSVVICNGCSKQGTSMLLDFVNGNILVLSLHMISKFINYTIQQTTTTKFISIFVYLK